jgi:hypothetical protein
MESKITLSVLNGCEILRNATVLTDLVKVKRFTLLSTIEILENRAMINLQRIKSQPHHFTICEVVKNKHLTKKVKHFSYSFWSKKNILHI